MMDITPTLSDAAQQLDGYGPGFFTVSNQRYESAVLVFPEKCVALEQADIQSLAPDALLSLIQEHANETELILFGSGNHMQPIPAPLKTQLRAEGIASDVMDTGAACRTFNILLSESRQIAAVLFPISSE